MTPNFSFVLVATILHGLVCSGKETLELLTLLPYYTNDSSFLPSWSSGDDIFPALQLAKDQINNDTTLLPNYNLELVQGKSGCQFTSDTVAEFLQEMFYTKRSRKIVGVVGPGCSSSSLALAPIASRAEISTVMVHVSGAAALSNRTSYPFLLGNLGSTDNYAYAAISLIKGKWGKVALLFDESRQFYLHIQRTTVKGLGNSVDTLPIPVYAGSIPLSVIREEVRVILVMCPAELTRQIICLSWKERMRYPDYQFVFTAHTESDLVMNVSFRQGGKDVFCSADEIQQALRMHILLVSSFKTSIAGHLGAPLNTSYSSFLKKYDQYRMNYNNQKKYIGTESSYNVYAGYMYDSVWGWATVLDTLSNTYPNFFNDSSSTVYGNNTKSELIVDQFYRTQFNGVTGLFNFDRESGFTARPVSVIQISASGNNSIWEVDSRTQSTSGTRPEQIPSYFPVVRENLHYARFMVCIVLLVLLVTALMHVLTCIYRHRPAIKATTVHLLHISYVGVYVMLVGLFVFMLFSAVPLKLESRDKFNEVLWAWTLPIGFTLSLAPVGMRTWRVYRIFVHYLNPGPFISNKFLLLGVLLFVAVDLLVATAWTLSEALLSNSDQQSSQGTGNFTLAEPAPSDSQDTTSKWVLYAVLANKSILILWVTLLAFLTKGIKQLSFTTNSLRIFVYIATIVSVLGMSLTLLFSLSQVHPTFMFAALSATIILVCIAFIGCVFLPPLLPTLKTFRRQCAIVPWKRKWSVSPVVSVDLSEAGII